MPRKISIAHPTALGAATLPRVHDFQEQLGLVRAIRAKDGVQHLLTSTEVGRQAGLPGFWSLKGFHCNLIAESIGLITVKPGSWSPTPKGASYTKRVDGRWLWYPSVISVLNAAAQKVDLPQLQKARRAR